MHFYQKFITDGIFQRLRNQYNTVYKKITYRENFSFPILNFFFYSQKCIFSTNEKIEPMTKAMPFNQKRKKSLLFFHKPSGRKDKVRPKHIGLPKNIHRNPLPQAPC